MDAPRPFWMPDTKGLLAIVVVGLFGTTIFILMFKQGPADTTIFAVLTTLLGVLAGVIKDVYGYHFGSSASSSSKDDTISKMLPPAPPPTNGAVHDAAPVVAWWSRLTPEEQGAISSAAPLNPQVQAFIDAAKAGHASADDLAYLVSRGLLSETRSKEIQAA